MIGVYIRGKEMPNVCAYCFLDASECDLHPKVNIWRERHPDCPLIELPPHGNLKDESDIISLIEVMFCKDKDGMEHAIQCVKDASTVIEAEGETE